MAGLSGRGAGGSRRVRAARHDARMASAVARARRAHRGGAGLGQRRATDASAISAMAAAAHLWRTRGRTRCSRRRSRTRSDRIVALPEGCHMMGWYVMAGVRVMLKRATAAAEQRHGLGRTCDKARAYDGRRYKECRVCASDRRNHHVPRRFLSCTLSPAHGPQKGH
jgi:hypothetical protein